MAPIRRCQICGRESTKSLVCPTCGAIFYCSPKHAVFHWQQGHASECKRMQQQLTKAQALASFPFSFSQLTGTGCVDACNILYRLGVHRQGPWIGLCACGHPEWGTTGKVVLDAHSVQPLTSLAEFCGLPQPQMTPCLATQVYESQACTDWQSYYTARQLALSSPVSLLLDTVMTLHQGLCTLGFDNQNDQQCTIHIIGCQRELDEWPLFLELACLWPHLPLHLILFAPEMVDGLAESTFSWSMPSKCGLPNCHAACGAGPCDNLAGNEGLTLTFVQGLYHEVHAKQKAPDMIFCPNAGIAAYPTWRPTLQVLLGVVKKPCFISDICEEAALLAKNLVVAEADCYCDEPFEVPQVEVNAFRRPLSCQGEDNCLPSYSNGFLFWFGGAPLCG